MSPWKVRLVGGQVAGPLVANGKPTYIFSLWFSSAQGWHGPRLFVPVNLTAKLGFRYRVKQFANTSSFYLSVLVLFCVTPTSQPCDCRLSWVSHHLIVSVQILFRVPLLNVHRFIVFFFCSLISNSFLSFVSIINCFSHSIYFPVYVGYSDLNFTWHRSRATSKQLIAGHFVIFYCACYFNDNSLLGDPT